MVSKSKRKGSDFERLLVNLLLEHIKGSSWKKIPGSGAIGTSLDEPSLTSDVVGSVDAIPKKFRIECKAGYGGSKQLTVKKEWLDKIRKEADANFQIPILAAKFSGALSGTKVFIAMDIDTFAYLLNYITELDEECQSQLES
jgi:Holliday junction resolvase